VVRGLALVVAIGVLGGCRFERPADVGEDDAGPDAAIDGRVDEAPDAGLDAPHDASIDAQACSATSCDDGVLRICTQDGVVERIEECTLGCVSADRCHWLEPSNGLGDRLEDAAAQPAVTIPDGAVVDSDTGVIRSGSEAIVVATTTIAQGDGSSLRVFLARAFVVHDARVTGSIAVAFVAIDDVEIMGVLDLSADRDLAGPGGRTCTGDGAGEAETGGVWEPIKLGDIGGGDDYVLRSSGSGGGGFGSEGGDGGYGGSNTAPGSGGGRSGTATLVPLRGGCPGGGRIPGRRGAGGGAIQIVSAAGELRVAGAPTAGVDAGGGGGHPAAGPGQIDDPAIVYGTSGGGSGGGILFEAGAVVLGGSAAVIASGGGGGGGSGGLCTDAGYGRDAPLDGAAAAGGKCPPESWGTPAVGGVGAATDDAGKGGAGGYRGSGSGGGGNGRVRVNSASYTADPGAILRGELSTGSVTFR